MTKAAKKHLAMIPVDWTDVDDLKLSLDQSSLSRLLADLEKAGEIEVKQCRNPQRLQVRLKPVEED